MRSKPTHKVVVASKASGKRSVVGVAWKNPDNGFINIVLNAGVVLDWRMNETHWVNIYPVDDKGPDG